MSNRPKDLDDDEYFLLAAPEQLWAALTKAREAEVKRQAALDLWVFRDRAVRDVLPGETYQLGGWAVTKPKEEDQ